MLLLLMPLALQAPTDVRINVVAHSRSTHQNVPLEPGTFTLHFDSQPQPIQSTRTLGCKPSIAPVSGRARNRPAHRAMRLPVRAAHAGRMLISTGGVLALKHLGSLARWNDLDSLTNHIAEYPAAKPSSGTALTMKWTPRHPHSPGRSRSRTKPA